MHVLNGNILRQLQIHRGKIPDCLNPGIGNRVGNNLRFLCGYCDDCDVDVLLLDEACQRAAGQDLRILKLYVANDLLDIKDASDVEVLFILLDVACHRLTKSAVTDDNELIFLVQTQDIADLFVQIVDTVAVSLLSEPTEVV